MTDSFESRLHELAQDFPYPPTPPIAEKVMARIQTKNSPSRSAARKLALSLTIVLILLASLMAVPTVRAAVLEFIQIGIVRIFQPVEHDANVTPETQIIVTATSQENATPLMPILEQMAGETSLEEARHDVQFPIPLPAYPPNLGDPDRVFVQDANGDMAILVWIDPENPQRVKMSLHLIQAGSWAIEKVQPTIIEDTTVNGQPAAWTIGPYPLLLHNNDIQFTRLIEGNVLIWASDDITYRLETDLPLKEALKIAESLTAPSTP
ncbi:MAG: hypothetical protein HZB19_21605 [Chloroflexi bacterium]|nr:hypothetical protein [Chloroflexota bacterium]